MTAKGKCLLFCVVLLSAGTACAQEARSPAKKGPAHQALQAEIEGLKAAKVACATGRADEPPKPRLPVPVRAWFQPQFLDTHPTLYTSMNLITSLDDARTAELWSKRNVMPLKWAYGPQSEHSQGKGEYYRDQCEPFIKGHKFRFSGVGIDEWNPADPRYATEHKLAAEGYRQARKKWPDIAVVAWVTEPDETFLSLLRDGTFDLAIIEGFTFIPDVGGLMLDGIRKRCDMVKKAGLLDRAIVCFGYISAKPDSHGRRMTADDLARLVDAVRKAYPEMPGIAFYGFKDDAERDSIDLIRGAEELAAEHYPSK